MPFNPKTLREFRFSFQSAVASLEKQYNVKIELGNIKYSENEFRSQMTVTSVNNGVKVISEHDIMLMKLDAEMHGIKIPETGIIGMPVMIRGKEMKIIDYAPNCPKYPIILEDKTGNKIKTTWDTIGFQMIKRNN